MIDNSSEQKIDKYIIVKRLGRGGMGYVYHAKDPFIKRDVAIKIIHPDLAEDTMLIERFKREAQSAGGLRHPNIVTIYDLGEDKGRPYIAMEYLEGTDLEQLIKNKTFMPIDKKLDIIIQVCEGLDYAHKHGIIHRDITPSNIRILENNLVKIMDFGIAKITSSQITQTGTIMGKPHYMAPEQIRGEKVDGRTDIFALGVCLYEFLSYRKPFPGDNTTAVLLKIINDPPDPLVDENFEHPSRLEEIVQKALRKEPENRFQTAKEMADALREFIPQTKVTKHTTMIPIENAETILTPVPTQSVSKTSQSSIGRPQHKNSTPDILDTTIKSYYENAPEQIDTSEKFIPTKLATHAQTPTLKTELITEKRKKIWLFIAPLIIISVILLTIASISILKKGRETVANNISNQVNLTAPNIQNQNENNSQQNIKENQRPKTADFEKLNTETNISAPKKLGYLRLNILPWAQIVKITNKTSNKSFSPTELYTPCYMELDSGNYLISVVNPVLNKTASIEVEIREGEITTVSRKLVSLHDDFFNDIRETQ